MGLRLVKRSVNQDDVRAYHLFYADAAGTPGTDLTFFDWKMPGEQRDTRSIVRTHLRVTGRETLEWWVRRFAEIGVRADRLTERDGRLTLEFEDPEGQRLALVDDGGRGDPPVPWAASPVPAAHQLRGLGPIVLSVPDLPGTETILTQVMNLRPVRHYAGAEGSAAMVHVYEIGRGGPHAELHVAVEPSLAPGRRGAGGVHHVAFRTPNEDEYHAWKSRLDAKGVPNSGEIDRYYFRSLYFREPNGILFEIATDGPGFAVDEDAATLGEHLALPPFLEAGPTGLIARRRNGVRTADASPRTETTASSTSSTEWCKSSRSAAPWPRGRRTGHRAHGVMTTVVTPCGCTPLCHTHDTTSPCRPHH